MDQSPSNNAMATEPETPNPAPRSESKESWLQCRTWSNQSQGNSNQNHLQNPTPTQSVASNTSIFTQSAFLTPIHDERAQPGLHELPSAAPELHNNRVFNYTKSKTGHERRDRQNEDPNPISFGNQSHGRPQNTDQPQHVDVRSLRVPIRNDFLCTESERVD